VQSVPQVTPVGLLATVPVPVPLFVTVSVYVVGAAAAHTISEYGESPNALYAFTR
jgi:hypothetical protein